MAKFERKFHGNFDEVLCNIENGILNGSLSATLEDKSDYILESYRCAVRVFEKYYIWGRNRMSLNVTLVGVKNDLFISAITSGGSQAIFFKLNTEGEETFLEEAKKIIENYIASYQS